MQLSIIIVNYNVKHFLEQCLFSVLKAAETIGNTEVLVVDNNSKDGSVAYLQPLFPTIKFIANKENTGFAKANNLALQMCKGKYILFLNPDTIVPEDCFTKCITFFNQTQDCGAIGVRMLDGKGSFLPESKRSFPSPITSLYKLVGLAAIFPNSSLFNKYALGNLNKHNDHKVDVLAGAFMMIKKEVLDVVGSFDETFFMYGEDVDLSYRLQQFGLNNYYLGTNAIVHFKGESTKRGSLNYIKMFYNAMNIFVSKHYGKSKANIFSIFIKVAIFLRAIISVLKRIINKITLPFFDVVIIYLSFYFTTVFWEDYFREGLPFNSNIITFSIPIFSIIFVFTAWLNGLYDNLYKPSKVIQASLLSIVAVLAVYALFPENIRYSRGVILLGGFVSAISITIFKSVLWLFNLIEDNTENNRQLQTIVVGNKQEYNHVMSIYTKAHLANRVLGNIDIIDVQQKINLKELNQIIATQNIKEIVFCQGILSFKQIIEIIQQLPSKINYRFCAANSNSIVGSDNKATTGEMLTVDGYFNLNEPYNKRTKRFVDLCFSLFIIITFPIQIILIKKIFGGIKSAFDVLMNKKTFIGYVSNYENNLPLLKPCIINVSGNSNDTSTTNLSAEILIKLNTNYAREYDWWKDVKLICRNYKKLGD